MKTIQLTFLFEDTGFCKDVFQSVNQPYYYCNRDTVDGTWYTSTPDDYQNDCRIRKDVIIEIISDGQVIALDGNGDFEGKKPFIPFCTFRERLAQEFLDKHLWGDRIFEKCGIRRDEEGDGGKTLEIRGKRRLSARDGGANYQQS